MKYSYKKILKILSSLIGITSAFNHSLISSTKYNPHTITLSEGSGIGDKDLLVKEYNNIECEGDIKKETRYQQNICYEIEGEFLTLDYCGIFGVDISIYQDNKCNIKIDSATFEEKVCYFGISFECITSEATDTFATIIIIIICISVLCCLFCFCSLLYLLYKNCNNQ